MTITLNGKEARFETPLTITGLLKQTGHREVYVAVEINEEIIPKTEFQTHQINEGDIVEIVTFMGGGCR